MFLMILLADYVADVFMKPSDGVVGEPVEIGGVFLLYITNPITMASKVTPLTATPTIAPADNLAELALHWLEQESPSSVFPSSHSSESAWIPSPHTVTHIKEILLNW